MMLGHELVIGWRLRGRRPAGSVHVDVGPVRPWFAWRAEQGVPTVWVQPSDRVERLDMRWAVGLHVLAAASREVRGQVERAVAVGRRIAEHGARSVQAYYDDGDALVVCYDSLGERAEGSRWRKC